MSIILVSERPNPVVRAGDGPGILYNRDPAVPLYIGSDTSIVNGNLNSASILDPLSSIFVGGDTDIWACAPVGTTPDNAIAVDFIHSGRSQHYTSPSVLTETINGIPETIGTSVGTNLLPVLNQILQAISNLSSGGTISPVITSYLQSYQQPAWNSYAATGVRQIALTSSFSLPPGTVGIIFLANASGQMTDVAGIMLEIEYDLDSQSSSIIPIQTGYQGGYAILSGNYSATISAVGATIVNYSVLITCTTGTWTTDGTILILCQIGIAGTGG